MKHPIVLAHGIAPFDRFYQPLLRRFLGVIRPRGAPDEFNYFKGIGVCT